jgi:CxxC motif-containing protein (DUF1111 family)
MKRKYIVSLLLASAIAGPLLFRLQLGSLSAATFTARDPGVRGGTSVGNPLPNLTARQLAYFNVARAAFMSAEGITDGLGPRVNLDSCVGCHSYPTVGGSSPLVNPQVAFATSVGADNTLPSFISANGPVREVRFVRNPDGTPDGGVHSLFTIGGRTDAQGCTLAQPDFATAVTNNNAIFRIPTPVFGAGLIEQIPDSTILANHAASTSAKQALGIRGRPNIVLAGSAISGQPNFNGNDGTAARFGWKAQNKSLLLFAGEAYNVEMGITNELFQTERDETPGCQFAATPNDVSDTEARGPIEALSDVEKFALFMRFLAPPAPSPNYPGGATSIARGRTLFSSIGCAYCHTPTLKTGNSSVAALSNQPVNLYSDLLIHDMGGGLADGISQGQAGPSEFRTAPLWGLGQRIFFLHDGRTSDLMVAIQQHQSAGTRTQDPSEANGVIANFNRLSEGDKQNLLNFLRSL